MLTLYRHPQDCSLLKNIAISYVFTNQGVEKAKLWHLAFADERELDTSNTKFLPCYGPSLEIWQMLRWAGAGIRKAERTGFPQP